MVRKKASQILENETEIGYSELSTDLRLVVIILLYDILLPIDFASLQRDHNEQPKPQDEKRVPR